MYFFYFYSTLTIFDNVLVDVGNSY